MELFSDILTLTFSKDKQRRILFHPWGLYGKGYVISETSQVERVQSFIRRFTSLAFIGLVIMLLMFGWRFGLIFGGVMIGGYFLRVKILVRRCSPVNVPFRHRFQEVAILYKYTVLWFLFLFSVLGLLFSIYIMFFENLLLGFFGVGMFGLTTFTYSMMLYLRDRTGEEFEYD